MEYSTELMETAKNTLNKFKTFKSDCLAYLKGKKIGSNLNASTILQNLNYAKSNINSCIKDDFDTSRCISILLDQISGISRCINTNNANSLENETSSCLDAIAGVNNYVDYVLQSFGFTFVETKDSQSLNNNEHLDINILLEDILNTRQNIRERAVKSKNKELFQICDDLRNCLKQHGIEIRDHSQGSSWNFIENKK